MATHTFNQLVSIEQTRQVDENGPGEKLPNRVAANSHKTIREMTGMESLLIAEDEETVRVLLKRTLERAGYKVLAADNGENAVALFKKNPEISLVLSDLVMPGKNGKEMIADIREIRSGIKVLFMSGYSADTLFGKGILGENDELITKPFKINDLLNKIRELLDKD